MKTHNQLLREKYLEEYYKNPNICKHCNNIILVQNKQKIKEVKRKIFCNRSCAAAFNSKLFPKRKCAVCKKLTKRVRNKTCSKKCQKKIKTPVELYTKGELFTKSKNWQSARSTIQHKARKAFFSSNLPKECKICNYSNHIEISHIKSVSSFEESSLIKDINNLENLIPLCPNHHWEFDNGLLYLTAIGETGKTRKL